MGEYPEHEKMVKVREESIVIGNFLGWLSEQGVALAVWVEIKGEWDEMDGKWTVPDISIEERLAVYFGINLKVIEAEKQAMLEIIRSGRS